MVVVDIVRSLSRCSGHILDLSCCGVHAGVGGTLTLMR